MKTMNGLAYNWLLRRIVPRIRFSLYYPHFTGRQFWNGYYVLTYGDILLSRDSRKLSSYLIPGSMPHAAVLVENWWKRDRAWFPREQKGEIVEAVAEGVRLTTWFEFCHESDRVMILRCIDWGEEYALGTIIPKALELVGTPYDNQFHFDSKAMYCSELPYHCDIEHRAKVNTKDLFGLGYKYVSAQDWLDAENVKVVWDSDWEK